MMVMADSKRKLAAIVFTDIVGFTKLSAKNEPAALALLEKQRELLKSIVEKHGGSWLKEIGDGLLLSFNTSRDAVDCSIAIQEATKKVDGLDLRIGIHQGEVVFQGSDVVGDDVNIAARIEPFAAAGGIAISGRVNTSLERDPEFETMFIGTPALKGVSQKTEVYCITSHDLPKTDISKVSAKLEPEGFQWNVFSLTGAVLTVIGVLFWINVSFLGIGIADTPDVPSIAILPFENKGAPEDDFYAYGISSDLITDVTGAGLIRVASLSDVEKLDYKNINNSELAKSLFVRYVAKGTLWKMDSIFQLSMEIFDTKSSKVVYNKRWQTNWKDLATIKDDLSDNILETLEIEVIRDVEDQIVESNPEAYEYYLKGKYKFEKRVSIEDLEIARGFFQKAIELDSSLLKAMLALAKTYAFTNEYDRSIEIYNKALKRSEELNNKVQKAYALLGLGTSYIYRDGDLDKALEYYEKGSELAKETGDKTLNYSFLNNIAIIHNRRGDSEKALEMMEELLTIVEALDDKTGQVLALNNIGGVYAAKGEKDRSNDYYKRSLSLSREIGDKVMEGLALANIGNYHMGKKQYDLAIKLFNESLEIYKKLGDKEGRFGY